MTNMRNGAAAVMLAALALAGCGTKPLAGGDTNHQAQVERGKYLVTVGGCQDCHTPWVMGPEGPEPDATRMLSGHPADVHVLPVPEVHGAWEWVGAGTNTAFAGPWGISFARNLTPDELTGIGIWTEDIFIQTIRTGRHWGVSRPILPPMPWQNYREMSDPDLAAVFAYLKSLPPVRNQVPLEVTPDELATRMSAR